MVLRWHMVGGTSRRGRDEPEREMAASNPARASGPPTETTGAERVERIAARRTGRPSVKEIP